VTADNPFNLGTGSTDVFNIRQGTLFWFKVLHFIKKSSSKPVTNCLKSHISHLQLFSERVTYISC